MIKLLKHPHRFIYRLENNDLHFKLKQFHLLVRKYLVAQTFILDIYVDTRHRYKDNYFLTFGKTALGFKAAIYLLLKPAHIMFVCMLTCARKNKSVSHFLLFFVLNNMLDN